MAKECSFDIVSEFDRQELVNAIDQAKREISTRFDLKDSKSDIVMEKDQLTITTSDEMKLKNILDILQTKMLKRNLSINILSPGKVQKALGSSVKQFVELKKGISQDLAKKIVSDIKSQKLKVQPSIQGDSLRVTGKSKDDLQQVISFIKIKESEYKIPLQFQNYR